MTRKIENKISIGEKIENYLYSDTPGAMATKVVLMIIATGTVAFGGAIIPGIFKIFESFREASSVPSEKTYSKRQIENALNNLKKRKFVKIIKEKNGRVKIKLTNKGRKRILEMSLDSLKIKKLPKWDGKWRIVVFDIPVKQNPGREALRKKMKNLGFKQLQKSVWIIPWECEDEMLFIAEMYKVEKYVEIITADNILHEKEFRQVFQI